MHDFIACLENPKDIVGSSIFQEEIRVPEGEMGGNDNPVLESDNVESVLPKSSMIAEGKSGLEFAEIEIENVPVLDEITSNDLVGQVVALYLLYL